jgi:P-type conjugative transfer protein TrbJ
MIMRTAWNGSFGALVMALALALMISRSANAITVFDPTNYAQNILQATRALEQINNQIRQIEQQAQMLTRNRLQLSPELSQSIDQARQLFSTAQGLTFQVNQMSQQLHQLYPETWENFDLGQIGDRTEQWLSQDRAAIESSMQAEARAAQSIQDMQGRIDRALQSSADAEGQTGVGQATNQLLGINAAQLAEIHALLIAQGRALETERLERIAREQRAGEIQRRAFPTQSNVNVDPARSAFDH